MAGNNKTKLAASNRAALIRQGNEAFNRGDIKTAIQIYAKTQYHDGLARLGDYFYYQQKKPIQALQFYQRARHRQGIDMICRGIAGYIRKLLLADESNQQWHEYIESGHDPIFNKKFLDSVKLENDEDALLQSFTEQKSHIETKKTVADLDKLRNKLHGQKKY